MALSLHPNGTSTPRLHQHPKDAAILYEVSHPDNPDWSDAEVLLGYAAVNKYTVEVRGASAGAGAGL